MDPTMNNRLGLIRQQEILEEAERYQQAKLRGEEQLIWERLWAWGGAFLSRLPKLTITVAVSRKQVTAPDMNTEYC